MQRLILWCVLIATAAWPGGAVEPVSVFPRPAWFRQHFVSPKTRVELQTPRRLSDFVVNGKLELSLRAYIELALQNNTDIALARLLVESPANAIQRAFADYDPNVSASYSSQRSTQTSYSSLEGVPTVKTRTDPLGATYSQLLPSGSNLNVSFFGLRYSTNQVYSTYNPILQSNLTVSVDHPLLRNRGASIVKMNVMLARSTLRISHYQLRDQATALIAAAENAYWDVVEARENAALATEFLNLRAAALDRAQKQVDAGALLPLDIYQPKSEYASAQVSVIQAKRVLSQRENALRQQVGADLDPAIRTLPIVLTEPLDIPIVAAPDKEAEVSKAMQARPDRQTVAAALDADDIQIRRATENLRPSVSLTGSYESQGLGGTYLPTGVPGGLGDALSQMFGFGYPVYQVGLRVSLPIRGRAAAADLADTLVRKKQDALTLRKLEQSLRLQVLNAVENLDAARASLEQAQLAREYGEKRFATEQKKYELGITQLFFVLQAQTDFNVVENAVLEQSINYRRNLIILYQMTGQLLDQRGIVLE